MTDTEKSPGPRSDGPLAGIRVIEMTEALAGPYCAMMLGDLGADVIKVERDQGGDQARGWGPPFLGQESAYFLSVNRNKRSVALDIKVADDLADLIRIIKGADVFITNNPRMESLQKYGLDPDSLRSANPGLVYAAISGYGHTGPKAGQPGYDLIAQGEAGLMALTGEAGSGPMRFPTPMADITAGLYTAIAIQSALYARDNDARGSGKGDFIDVSLVDAQMTWLANVGGTHFATGQRPPKLGNAHPTVAPYQPMRARDKAFIVAVGTERIWKKFCTALGVDELVADARFVTNAARNQHREELVALLESVLGKRDADEWVVELTACGVPAGPINAADEAVSSDQAKARGMVVELQHPSAGPVKSLGNPIQMANGGPTYRRYPPRLGEHTAEIRAESTE